MTDPRELRGPAAVVATNAVGLMGRDGGLPWRCPEDLRVFKALTVGHVVIMGRRTYESIGRPLPGRVNIVLSRSMAPRDGLVVARTKAEALDAARAHEPKRAFVIGGREVYDLLWDETACIYHSRIDAPDAHGDVHYPLERLVPPDWERIRTDAFETFERDVWVRGG